MGKEKMVYRSRYGYVTIRYITPRIGKQNRKRYSVQKKI